MRTLAAALLCLLCWSPPVRADADPSPGAQYHRQRKSVLLATTLEVVCPIAGAGAFYTGEKDQAIVLASRSAISAAVAVGSGFYLIHLAHQRPSGAGRALYDLESATAWTGLVVGGVLYLLTRINGLALAADAVTSFNVDLQQRLGLPADGPQPPLRAQVSGLSLRWRF